MRFLLPLVALCALSSAPLRAEVFYDITLTSVVGGLSGSGTFTTDVQCGFCAPNSGLLSLTINIGPDSGAAAFDIIDDQPGAEYIRDSNALFYIGRDTEFATNSETGDRFALSFAVPNSRTWELLRGTLVDTGTYSVAPVPEPRSLFLLMPIVAIVGLRWRHQRHRV
jgi:hypothetical protein